MNKFLLLLLLLAASALAGDDSCGCITQYSSNGWSIGDNGRVWCYGIAAGSAGTLDSIIFWAKDYAANGDDTLYVMVYDTLTGGDIDALKDRSNDSIIVTGQPSGWNRYSLPLESGSVAAGEFVYICIWAKGLATNTNVSICNDGTYNANIREFYIDAPELENPATGVTSDTTNYAPSILLYWTTESGAATKKTGKAKLGKIKI